MGVQVVPGCQLFVHAVAVSSEQAPNCVQQLPTPHGRVAHVAPAVNAPKQSGWIIPAHTPAGEQQAPAGGQGVGSHTPAGRNSAPGCVVAGHSLPITTAHAPVVPEQHAPVSGTLTAIRASVTVALVVVVKAPHIELYRNWENVEAPGCVSVNLSVRWAKFVTVYRKRYTSIHPPPTPKYVAPADALMAAT